MHDSPWSVPQNLHESSRDSQIQILLASDILTESSLYTRERERNDASYTW